MVESAIFCSERHANMRTMRDNRLSEFFENKHRFPGELVNWSNITPTSLRALILAARRPSFIGRTAASRGASWNASEGRGLETADLDYYAS